MTTVTTRPGVRWTRGTFPTMGTIASLRVDAVTEATFADADRLIRDSCDRWEAEFTRHRPSSPASRIAAGELRLQDSSDWHRDVYADAIAWRNRTGGAFDPHRPDGTVDLAGIVKALAIRDAGNILAELGCDSWCLNVGGDVLTSGLSDGRPWRVGIVDATDRSTLWRAVTLREDQHAVATSGTAERGDHIWRAGVGRRILQCSVIAGDIVTADVLATAVVAGGAAFAEAAAAEYGVALRIVFDDSSELVI